MLINQHSERIHVRTVSARAKPSCLDHRRSAPQEGIITTTSRADAETAKRRRATSREPVCHREGWLPTAPLGQEPEGDGSTNDVPPIRGRGCVGPLRQDVTLPDTGSRVRAGSA